jgi:hypothetical protein
MAGDVERGEMGTTENRRSKSGRFRQTAEQIHNQQQELSRQQYNDDPFKVLAFATAAEIAQSLTTLFVNLLIDFQLFSQNLQSIRQAGLFSQAF